MEDDSQSEEASDEHLEQARGGSAPHFSRRSSFRFGRGDEEDALHHAPPEGRHETGMSTGRDYNDAGSSDSIAPESQSAIIDLSERVKDVVCGVSSEQNSLAHVEEEEIEDEMLANDLDEGASANLLSSHPKPQSNDSSSPQFKGFAESQQNNEGSGSSYSQIDFESKVVSYAAGRQNSCCVTKAGKLVLIRDLTAEGVFGPR